MTIIGTQKADLTLDEGLKLSNIIKSVGAKDINKAFNKCVNNNNVEDALFILKCYDPASIDQKALFQSIAQGVGSGSVDLEIFREGLSYIDNINTLFTNRDITGELAGNSPLHNVLARDMIDHAIALLDKDANPNDPRSVDGQRILARAIQCGGQDPENSAVDKLVNKLLEKGAIIDTTAYCSRDEYSYPMPIRDQMERSLKGKSMCEYAIAHKRYDIATTLLLTQLQRDPEKFKTEVKKISQLAPVSKAIIENIGKPQKVKEILNDVFSASKALALNLSQARDGGERANQSIIQPRTNMALLTK